MRVVFCWWTFQGYYAACWKQLARRADIDLLVLALQSDPQSLAPHDTALLDGLNVHLLPRNVLSDSRALLARLIELRPDVAVIPGIVSRAALWAVRRPELRGVAVIMAWDRPWRNTWRQRLARVVLRPYLARIDRMVVAGENARECVRAIGFDASRISPGMYGIDWDVFADTAEARSRRELRGASWPRAFCFVGRYVQEKGVPELAEAYVRYCREVNDPWSLIACGRGPLRGLLAEVGARDEGFLPPQRLSEVLRGSGAGVLASRFEPWGVALVEACAAGLPVICTDVCGAAVEIVRPFFNGLSVPTADATALAEALRWMHEHPDQLPEMGRRSRVLAQAYSAQSWADNWAAMIAEVARG